MKNILNFSDNLDKNLRILARVMEASSISKTSSTENDVADGELAKDAVKLPLNTSDIDMARLAALGLMQPDVELVLKNPSSSRVEPQRPTGQKKVKA